MYCQEQEESGDQVRRLRFRRPRPKLLDIENPEGELVGSPIQLSAIDSEDSVRTSGSQALDALIKFSKDEVEPLQLEIEEIPTQAPLQLNEAEPKPVRLAAGRRRIAGVPRRGQGRPGPQQGERAETVRGDDDTPRGRPREGVKQEPVGTLEKYSHNNADGSFTFGYVGADGSFREETRGVDCITRGKYGYIDPDGVKREYSYTSGLPCSVGENGEQNLDIDGNAVVEDPVDPRERFRQTSSVQLDEVDIPEEAKRQRVRPEDRPQEDPNLGQTAFTNFGAQPAQRRPAQPLSLIHI